MRRTIFMAIVAAVLLLVPSAAQAQTQEILRDCNDDGVLQGDYSASAMRTARNNMPTELDEYGDCRDVLTRAIADKTAKPKSDDSSGGDSSSGGGGGDGSSSGTGGGSTDPNTGTPSATPTPGPGGIDSGHEVPQAPPEWAAITEAQKGVNPNPDDLKQVSPGGERLSADVGRNALPGTLIGVLALIAAAAFALVAAPLIRKRGLGPSQP
ncbi:hypothetical protein OJ998_20515 [Solirubrobacter taibaiensis]|nr:hypothetical protein [Solirubrobacter taibaiensis]